MHNEVWKTTNSLKMVHTVLFCITVIGKGEEIVWEHLHIPERAKTYLK